MPEAFCGADIPAQALCALLCHYWRNEEAGACLNKWSKGVGGVLRKKAIIHYFLKSQFLQRSPVSFLSATFRLCFAPSFFCWVFMFACSHFPPLPPPPMHPRYHHPPLRCSCVHFVPLKFIELAPTAEMQKIREALSLLLTEKWYCTLDEWAPCLCASVSVGGGGGLTERLWTEEMGSIVFWCSSWKSAKGGASYLASSSAVIIF